MNSSLVEETPLNSFLSPRASSVTVMGKKLYSHSSLSVTQANEKKFPIPLQSLKKINRQKLQPKVILNKKTLKNKTQEQPAPVPNVSKVYSSPPALTKKKKKIRKKPLDKKESKNNQALTERPNLNPSKVLKQSEKFELNKKKQEKTKEKTEKKKIQKKNLAEKKTQKTEKNQKGKKEKLKTDCLEFDRKSPLYDRVLRDIEKQREAQKNMKKYQKIRKNILNKVLDFDSFKPRSSSIPSSMPKETPKIKPVKKTPKNQRKKNAQTKIKKITEKPERENKRIINLKLLNNSRAQERQKSSLRFKPKKIGFQESEEEVCKNCADKSSEFLFEPDSQLKDQMSEFSEESTRPKFDKVSAVIKIQYFLRKYLKKKQEDAGKKEVLKSESFRSSTVETGPKSDEIKEEKLEPGRTEPLKCSSDNNNPLNDSASDIQVTQNPSISAKDYSENSVKSDANSQVDSNENTLISFKKNSNENSLVSEIDYSENDCKLEKDTSKNPNFSENESKKISSQEINNLSEAIIQNILIESLTVQTVFSKIVSIEKDPIPYIDQIVFHTPQKDFKINLNKPIRKNPLEILAKIQISSDIFVNSFDSLNVPPVIPLSVFSEIESSRQPTVQELRDSQKAHNRLVFDSCNEQLHKFRPYGTQGFPLPWSSGKRTFNKPISNIFKIIPKVARKIEILSQFEAGKIADYLSEALQSKPEDYLTNMREEKIGLLILQDIKNEEGNWTDYEYQEISATVNVGSLIFSDLIHEIIQII